MDSATSELRRGLVPKVPPPGELPRVLLREGRESHRQECLERELGWEAELAGQLATAEEVG